MRDRFTNRLNEAFRSFFVIVTLINIAMYILGRIFQPDLKFGYEAMIYPVIYGLITSLPHLIMGDERVMTVKQVIIQKVIQLMLILAIILTFIFGGSPLNGETVPMMAGVALSVVFVYIAVQAIMYCLDSRSAEKMTQELIIFQERRQENA